MTQPDITVRAVVTTDGPHLPDPTTRQDYARIYVDNGWKVFVLSPSKVPVANCEECAQPGYHDTVEEKEACTCLTCHALYAATDDLDRIDAMLARHPDGLLAIRTGAVSNLVVIDVDPPEGLATLANMKRAGVIRETAAVRTGSGGWHLFYQHPGGKVLSGAGKAGPKVDVKADGGYVVAPPSIHPRTGQPYTWYWDFPTAPRDVLHPRLRAHIQPPEPERRPIVPRDYSTITQNRLRGIVRTLLNADNGHRNDTLHWAAAQAGELVASGEITEQAAYEVLAEAAERIGLPPSEYGSAPHRGTIGSGMRKGMRK
ncbi:bifunctional DNA primase/polymerase [Nocardiopsis sp. CA-288880]|uniref:bifunctional DNA primase/polymerase n=1 Tax=Nocardiopsis sp. CA-288880 TaxID=3239995 RepID=UPI003D962CDF